MLVFAATRWPGLMPPNFSAAYALSFCAGVYFPGAMAWWLPLVTLFATDLALGLHYRALYLENPTDFTHPVTLFSLWQLISYVLFAGLIWLGRRLTSKSSFTTLLGGGLLGAILFYIASNTASWLANPAYPKTLSGWLQALSGGLPGYPPTWEFFRNTLSSGGLFTALFVGAMKLSEAAEESKEESAEETKAGEGQPEETKA